MVAKTGVAAQKNVAVDEKMSAFGSAVDVATWDGVAQSVTSTSATIRGVMIELLDNPNSLQGRVRFVRYGSTATLPPLDLDLSLIASASVLLDYVVLEDADGCRVLFENSRNSIRQHLFHTLKWKCPEHDVLMDVLRRTAVPNDEDSLYWKTTHAALKHTVMTRYEHLTH